MNLGRTQTLKKCAARFGYDLDAILSDLREEQEQAQQEGQTIVAAPPRSDHSAEPAA